MQDIESAGRELLSGKKGGAIRAAAQSEEGRRLAGMFAEGEVERAAKSGDAKALGAILEKVMSSPDGRALAEKLRQTMQGK